MKVESRKTLNFFFYNIYCITLVDWLYILFHAPLEDICSFEDVIIAGARLQFFFGASILCAGRDLIVPHLMCRGVLNFAVSPLKSYFTTSNEYSLSINSRPHDHKLRKYLSLKSRILYLTQCVNDLQIWIINTFQHNI